jgi:DNA invertase Pin-like site-specific DNA recombinase
MKYYKRRKQKMLIGYVRVSTEEQNEARQITALQERNVNKLFVDKKSGKNADREALKEMLLFVRDGDTIIMESISRIARSTKDLLNIIDTLTQKNVEFISLKENIDTTTPQGKFMLTVLLLWQSWKEKTYCSGKKKVLQ